MFNRNHKAKYIIIRDDMEIPVLIDEEDCDEVTLKTPSGLKQVSKDEIRRWVLDGEAELSVETENNNN